MRDDRYVRYARANSFSILTSEMALVDLLDGNLGLALYISKRYTEYCYSALLYVLGANKGSRVGSPSSAAFSSSPAYFPAATASW